MTAPDPARDRAAHAGHRAYGYASADHKNWLPVVDAVAAELAKPTAGWELTDEEFASFLQAGKYGPTPASPDPAEALAVLGELVAAAKRDVCCPGNDGMGTCDQQCAVALERYSALSEALELFNAAELPAARALVEGEAGLPERDSDSGRIETSTDHGATWVIKP